LNNLVEIKNDEIYVATNIIAQELERKHQTIIKVVINYEKELQMLGVLRFEIVKHEITDKGGAPKKIYYLNEEQYIFVITNMRTKPNEMTKVMKAKLEISRQFVSMRKALLQIKLQQQNQEWIETRKKGKESRKEFTDAIKKLHEEHCKNNPDSTYVKKPNLLYSNITRMINKALFDIQITTNINKRDCMTKHQLSYLDTAEIKMQEIIHKCIDENKDAKETYKILQIEIEPYAKFIGKSNVIDLLIPKQISMFES